MTKWNGLTRSPLSRSRKPIKRMSAKREAVSEERRAFVADMLERFPVCPVSWENCTVRTVDVHEALPRSAAGAIVPGEKATAQGQKFWALCRPCHSQITNPTALERMVAIEAGWLISRWN
jgi:hypothetical protein